MAAAVGLILAGCGGGSGNADQFSWLHPGAAPAHWRTVSIPNGAALAYPGSWRRVHGDSGTATATLSGAGGTIVGYLNVTPRQGSESPANWTSFRISHNAQEGDRHVVRLASGTGLRFRSGTGSCVRDSYTTSSGRPYIELACIVRGARATTVIVGASPPSQWPRISPQIQQAISALRT